MSTATTDRGTGSGDTSSPPSRRWRVVLALALLAQLVVLYAPSAPAGPVSWTDKVVHVLVFAVPAAALLVAGVRGRWLLLLALHAPLSEVVQHTLLPHRSGDPADAVADLAGVLLGVGIGMVVQVVRGIRFRW